MAYSTSVQIKTVTLSDFLILKSYLHSRHFLVKDENEYTELSSVNADVLQGSVLGPLFYLLYTAEMPTSPESITALCQWYCSTSQGQWFSHCITQTGNQPICNPKLV
jgi:hypothetical protein